MQITERADSIPDTPSLYFVILAVGKEKKKKKITETELKKTKSTK